MVLTTIPTFFVREENSLELVMLKKENLEFLSSKPLQTLLSLSLKMLRGFSQVHQQTMSSLQSLMKVFGLLETTTGVKEGLLEMRQMIGK